MRKFIYLFFINLSFSIVWAQNTPAETAISKRLIAIESTEKREAGIEKELLQLKKQSEKLKYLNGILRSGVNLMNLYLEQSRNKEAADLGSVLKKTAANSKDTEGFITLIYMKNALALGYLGLDDEAHKDFRKALHYHNEIRDKDQKQYLLSLCYENMTVSFNNSKRFEDKKYRDSVIYYLKKSNEAVGLVSDSSKTITENMKYSKIAFNNMRMGIFYLEDADKKGKIDLAEKQLLAGSKIYENKKYRIHIDDKVMMLNQLSWLYMEKKDYKKSIDFANRALALEKQFSDPYHRVESFEFLATSYLEIGEKEKSKYYLQKYTLLKDSINISEKGDTNKTMTKIASEIDQEHTEKTNKQLLFIGLMVLFTGLITAFLWRRKNKILRKKYEKIIENLNNEPSLYSADQDVDANENVNNFQDEKDHVNLDIPPLSQKNTISSETETRILKKLANFEKSTKFLRKDLTVGFLAGQLNTNSKYLSDIIKKHKSQNFSTYINHLKINFIIHKLYNEPNYREYKISYLADVCGYSSPQVFVIAFKKIHGMTPSYFIESLKEDNFNNIKVVS